MKVYICTDHDGHFPVGVASIIIASSKGIAKRMLDISLKKDGLKGFNLEPYTLEELDITKPSVYILNNGNY